jgi:hypothetical protein
MTIPATNPTSLRDASNDAPTRLGAARRLAAALMSGGWLRRRGVAVFGLLAGMTFFACYLRVFSFGLYEDDLNQARFWSYSAADMAEYVEKLFKSGAGGRPIGLTFLRGGFWAGFNIGGLPFLYLMGFIVFVTNAFLTYKLASKIAPAAIALLAAFVYVLFPADALKFTAVRGLAVQPSLTFGLGAMLFYAHRRYVAAYVFAALSVAVYEFGILPFFTAPFFVLEPWRAKLRRVVTHAGLTLGALGAIILVRLKYATGHLEDLTPLSTGQLIDRFYTALTIGPWTSFKGFFTKPSAFFRDFEPWHAIVFIAVAAIAHFGLARLWREDVAPSDRLRRDRMSPSERADAFFGQPNPALMILAGVAAWIIAYAMAVSESRFPPIREFGRTTSVHTAATFGASIAFAGLTWLAAQRLARGGLAPKRIVVPLIAVYFGMLGGFHAVVQSACVESWQWQKRWWRDIVAQTPDWRNGMVIIVDFERAPNRRYVYSMSWATAVIAENMFVFPKKWNDPPTVVFRPQLSSTASVVDDEFLVRRRPWFAQEPVNPDDLVYFSVDRDGSLKRTRKEFRFKNFRATPPPPGPAAAFEKKPLYNVLIGADEPKPENAER